MSDRAWVSEAIDRIEADFARSADTHLIRFELPALARHRPLPQGRSRPIPPAASSTAWRARCSSTRCATAGSGRGRTVIEASSGSTAVSEAYFARLLGPAVHRGDAAQHLAREDRADRVPGRRAAIWSTTRRAVYAESRAARGRAPAATTWTSSPTPSGRPTGAATTTSPNRSSRQMAARAASGAAPGSSAAPAPAAPRPRSAATSATSGCATRLCVADPGAVGVLRPPPRRPQRRPARRAARCIEGIGRPRVEPSFVPAIWSTA